MNSFQVFVSSAEAVRRLIWHCLWWALCRKAFLFFKQKIVPGPVLHGPAPYVTFYIWAKQRESLMTTAEWAVLGKKKNNCSRARWCCRHCAGRAQASRGDMASQAQAAGLGGDMSPKINCGINVSHSGVAVGWDPFTSGRREATLAAPSEGRPRPQQSFHDLCLVHHAGLFCN